MASHAFVRKLWRNHTTGQYGQGVESEGPGPGQEWKNNPFSDSDSAAQEYGATSAPPVDHVPLNVSEGLRRQLRVDHEAQSGGDSDAIKLQFTERHAAAAASDSAHAGRVSSPKDDASPGPSPSAVPTIGAAPTPMGMPAEDRSLGDAPSGKPVTAAPTGCDGAPRPLDAGVLAEDLVDKRLLGKRVTSDNDRKGLSSRIALDDPRRSVKRSLSEPEQTRQEGASGAGKEVGGDDVNVTKVIAVVVDTHRKEVCFWSFNPRADVDVETLCNISKEYRIVEDAEDGTVQIGEDVFPVRTVQHIATGVRTRIISKAFNPDMQIRLDSHGRAQVRLIPSDKEKSVSFASVHVKGELTSSLIKGTREDNDGMLLRAAAREMKEEAGIKPDYVELVTRVVLTNHEASWKDNATKAIYIFRLTKKGRENRDQLKPTDTFEVARVAWRPIRDLYTKFGAPNAATSVSRWTLNLRDVKAYFSKDASTDTSSGREAKRVRW